MSKPKFPVPADVKRQILERVKRGEATIPDIAQEHGLSPQVIYGWLSKGAIAPPTFAELARLQKENHALLEIIGRLTVELTNAKKKTALH
jgi:transposase-like protein